MPRSKSLIKRARHQKRQRPLPLGMALSNLRFERKEGGLKDDRELV
jgi:hypothetical protein